METEEMRIMHGYSCIALKQLMVWGSNLSDPASLSRRAFAITDTMMAERHRRIEAATPNEPAKPFVASQS
jgi:hypothetical protein